MADLIGTDCAKDYSNFAAAIKQAGVSFVGRYYRWPASRYTPLTYNEAAALSEAGCQAPAAGPAITDSTTGTSGRHSMI
jgi:hypothetical protein